MSIETAKSTRYSHANLPPALTKIFEILRDSHEVQFKTGFIKTGVLNREIERLYEHVSQVDRPRDCRGHATRFLENIGVLTQVKEGRTSVYWVDLDRVEMYVKYMEGEGVYHERMFASKDRIVAVNHQLKRRQAENKVAQLSAKVARKQGPTSAPSASVVESSVDEKSSASASVPIVASSDTGIVPSEDADPVVQDTAPAKRGEIESRLPAIKPRWLLFFTKEEFACWTVLLKDRPVPSVGERRISVKFKDGLPDPMEVKGYGVDVTTLYDFLERVARAGILAEVGLANGHRCYKVLMPLEEFEAIEIGEERRALETVYALKVGDLHRDFVALHVAGELKDRLSYRKSLIPYVKEWGENRGMGEMEAKSLYKLIADYKPDTSSRHIGIVTLNDARDDVLVAWPGFLSVNLVARPEGAPRVGRTPNKDIFGEEITNATVLVEERTSTASVEDLEVRLRARADEIRASEDLVASCDTEVENAQRDRDEVRSSVDSLRSQLAVAEESLRHKQEFLDVKQADLQEATEMLEVSRQRHAALVAQIEERRRDDRAVAEAKVEALAAELDANFAAFREEQLRRARRRFGIDD